MKFIYTTHNIEVFSEFLKHPLNRHSLNSSIIYIDHYNDSDLYSKYLKLIKKNTSNEDCIILNKTTLSNEYKENYYVQFKTFSKIYALHYILNSISLNEGFYFSDDDVVLYDALSFSDDEIICEKDPFFKYELYDKFPLIKQWIGYRNTKPKLFVSNFFIGKNHINNFKFYFNREFKSFMDTVKKDEYFLNLKAAKNNKRDIHGAHFVLDMLFFNVCMFHLKNSVSKKSMVATAFTQKLFKDAIETNTLYQFLYSLKTKRILPKYQPVIHFNTVDKLPLMRRVIGTLNKTKSLS